MESDKEAKMKKAMTIAAAAVLVLAAGTAMAVDTANVTVTASVAGTCSFASIPSVDFGSLDPGTNGAVNPAPVNLTFNCTNGIAYTLSDDKGGAAGSLSSNLSNGTDTVPYSLTYTNVSGVGLGAGGANEITSVLTGSIAAGTYGGISVGNYTDTIQFTINP